MDDGHDDAVTGTATTAINITNALSDINSNSSVSNATENFWDEICSQEDISPMTIFSVYFVILGILVIVNGLLLVVIAFQWPMLRQNVVYRYLISCILSAIVSCLFTTYGIIHTVLHLDQYAVQGTLLARYDDSNHAHYKLMHGWAYRKCLVVSLILVMEYNLVALIYGVSGNTHFVGRYSESIIYNDDNQKILEKKLTWLKALKGRNTKFAILITLAWLIPILMTTPTAFRWNCVEYCKCLPAYREMSTCDADDGATCSRLWLPLAGSYVIVTSTIYIIGLLIIFAQLARIIIKFYVISAPRKSRFSDTKKRKVGKVDALGRRDSKGGLRRVVSEDPSLNSGGQHSENDGLPNAAPRRNGQQLKPRSYSTLPLTRGRPPLHNNIKLLIAMAGFLFVSTTPTVAVFLDDIIRSSGPKTPDSALFISTVLTYIYVAALPFLLLFYMSSLRDAAAKTLMKCPCLSTTVVVTSSKSRTIRRVLQTVIRTNGDETKREEDGERQMNHHTSGISDLENPNHNEQMTGTQNETVIDSIVECDNAKTKTI